MGFTIQRRRDCCHPRWEFQLTYSFSNNTAERQAVLLATPPARSEFHKLLAKTVAEILPVNAVSVYVDLKDWS